MNPIIIALDLESATEARTLVNDLGDSASFYKVGLELYAAAGMDFVRELLGNGKKVFLDLKMYDIGETVKRAVAQVSKVGVQFLTIHAIGGVMEAAVEGKGDSSLQLLAVTVLTSFDDGDVKAMGHNCTLHELVRMRVKNAMAAGMNGIVCSPLEVAAVKAITGESMVLVTPGVRSAGANAGDQKRVASPAEAIRGGANYLVIGRQVTRAEKPRAEMERILAEVAG